jgi:NADPH:quinone reductase-like Zn-dependent oxidoreductase
MRAWHLTAPGITGLRLVDEPQRALDEHQVRVAMRAWSLNYRDIAISSGRRNLPLPLVPLSDGAGEVIEVGAAVTAVKPGDRVATCFFERWTSGEPTDEALASALGAARGGALAEEIVLHEEGVIAAPAHLDYQQVATLPCAALTAWNALFRRGQPCRPGDTVLLLGTGGVSIFGLQFALLAGARTIITSSSDDKLARARALGAQETVNYVANPEWHTVVRELTEGRGVDHIVEIGGPNTLVESLQSVRQGGRIALIGAIGGAGATDIGAAGTRRVSIEGIYVGPRDMFAEMNRAIGLHRLEPVIDMTFPFEEAPAAYEYMQSQSHFGKVVIAAM